MVNVMISHVPWPSRPSMRSSKLLGVQLGAGVVLGADLDGWPPPCSVASGGRTAAVTSGRSWRNVVVEAE